MPNQRMNRSRRGNRGRSNAGLRQKVNQTSKITQAVCPIRIRANKQLVSIPNHNYQLKIRKVFRVFAASPAAASTTISTTSILTAIQAELGIAAGVAGTGELIALHDIRVYSVIPNLGTLGIASVLNTLAVQIFDIEETSGSTRSGFFEDVGAPAGVTHVHALYPVNNRPTFSANTAGTTVAIIAAPQQGVMVTDFDITYIRTTVAPP